jgi:hypothetical protein
MRNRLVHGYFDIDTEIVWVTAPWNFPPSLTNFAASEPRRSARRAHEGLMPGERREIVLRNGHRMMSVRMHKGLHK